MPAAGSRRPPPVVRRPPPVVRRPDRRRAGGDARRAGGVGSIILECRRSDRSGHISKRCATDQGQSARRFSAALGPSPRRPRADGDAGRAEGGAVQQLRRAATSPGRRRAACTVAQVRLARLPDAGGRTRFGQSDAGRQFRRSPPAVRRRDRRRADGARRSATGRLSEASVSIGREGVPWSTR